jgi:glutaconate CoA-transferase subunit A
MWNASAGEDDAGMTAATPQDPGHCAPKWPQAVHDRLRAMARHVAPGMKLALPVDYAGVSMAMTKALIAQGTGDLHLICVPTGGLQVDQLIGAGLVRLVETSAVSLGEAGGAPRFNAAVKAGEIALRDSTCPAIHAGLMAAQKGSPFVPMRGLLGSDVLANRPDWMVIDNPFASDPQSDVAKDAEPTADQGGQPHLPSAAAPLLPLPGTAGAPLRDPIVLIPAIHPDVAIFHAPMADREGNVWIGRRRELAAMAYAARVTLVTVERIVDTPLLEDETLAAGTLPALYVTEVAVAPRGAWPYGLWGDYATDTEELSRYARLARSAAGFADYMEGGA